jgi:hypothetical protein
MKNLDVVVVVKKNILGKEFTAISQELITTINKIE